MQLCALQQVGALTSELKDIRGLPGPLLLTQCGLGKWWVTNRGMCLDT